MKTIARFTLFSLVLGAVAQAAPFLAIGDGAELFVTGAVGVRADDNIFLAKSATSDTIFNVDPGLELTFGKDAQVKGSLTLVDSITKYSSNSSLDTNLFSGNFASNYDDGKLKLGFNAGYQETNQNTVDVRPAGNVGALIRRNALSAGLTGETEVSEITSVGAGFSYTKTDYKRAGFGDSEDYTIPVNFYYKYSEKLDVSAGYRYRSYQTQIGEDSQDHFFNVGARGEFTPKLTGQVAVGWTQRTLAKSGDESLLGLDADLTYAISPKTSLQLRASNSPDTSPSGAQQKNFSFGGTLNTNITDQWSVSGGLSYRGITYVATTTTGQRTDDYVEGSLGVTYVINQWVRVDGNYAYRNNSSKIASSDFTNNVFSLSVSLRY